MGTDVARLLATTLPPVALLAFDERGHMGPITYPEFVNEAIARFLERTYAFQRADPRLSNLSHMSRTLFSFFALVAALYVGLCAALFVFQRALIYFPQPSTLGTPATILKLAVADADVLVSVRPHDGPKALIYFGGNAEDV
ncbi:MAG: alpha/beta fold hydrolase, partial [Gammaproteobacteria bacterium]